MKRQKAMLIENSLGRNQCEKAIADQKPRYYSCSITNSINSDYIHDKFNRGSNWSVEGIRRPKIVCLIFFFLCLGFYTYVVTDNNASTILGSTIISQLGGDKSNCFQKFRKQNCSLTKPMRPLCEELHQCASKGNSDSDHSAIKIANIEQLLENVLILLGGLGLGTIVGKLMFKSRRLLDKMELFVEKMFQFLKILRKKNHSGNPERCSWENQQNIMENQREEENLLD